jgi:hypothetical protein
MEEDPNYFCLVLQSDSLNILEFQASSTANTASFRNALLLDENDKHQSSFIKYEDYSNLLISFTSGDRIVLSVLQSLEESKCSSKALSKERIFTHSFPNTISSALRKLDGVVAALREDESDNKSPHPSSCNEFVTMQEAISPKTPSNKKPFMLDVSIVPTPMSTVARQKFIESMEEGNCSTGLVYRLELAFYFTNRFLQTSYFGFVFV